MLGWGERRRQRRLERGLRTSRPQARDELVRQIAARTTGKRPYARPRLGAAVALSAVLVAALVASGGAGYAARMVDSSFVAVKKTAKKIVVHPKRTATAHVVAFPQSSPASNQYGCDNLNIQVRWHYKVSTKTGGSSWSATKTVNCENGSIIIGPSTMEGDLKVNPGNSIVVGYDFKVQGATYPLQVTFHFPQAVFTPRCGSNPSNTTFTVTMPDQTYTVTSNDWFPSGDQSSPLVYQGSKVVPDLCGGGQVRFDKGGTFSASVTSP